MEDVVLYGPVAGSTAYCQVANINILDPLATTEADTVPRTRQVSSTQTEQLGDDGVDLQADGTGLMMAGHARSVLSLP